MPNMPTPNPFAHMAEYASRCYIADVADNPTVTIEAPSTPPLTTITKVHKTPKRTHLDVQVYYVDGTRMVYLRGKHRLGPMLSHMHKADIMKILSLV